MEKNKEKDTDKILGMNRVMFFIIVILLCILSLSIGIYAQVFYRYSDTDPFMLGIGVNKTQNAAEINRLKNEFSKICTNDLSGTTTASIKKKDDKYSISAYLPKVNINADYADKINAQISQDYEDTINDIIDNTKEDTDYSVTYKAYLNGDLLSILIKENIHKGKSIQSSKIKTYNYNLNNNTVVGIMDIVEAKKYKKKDIQKEIDTEIEALNKKDEEIKTQYSEVKLRDLNNSMYKIENTENFIINDQGYLYLIYAYGNTEDTNKIDTIIFE